LNRSPSLLPPIVSLPAGWQSMGKNHEVDVVTIGESMVLIQPIGEKGIKYEPLFSKAVAGAESNVAVGLTRMGKSVRWISKLGTDPFGDYILSTLSGEGIDTTYVEKDEQFPTAVYFKELRVSGDPAVYYYRKNSAASHLEPADVREEWFHGARHLHVTGITPALGSHTAAALRKSMELARSQGMTVSFDPNLRRKLWSEEEAREVLLSLIPLCDVFLPGEEEAEFLAGRQALEQYGKIFLEMGPKVVVIKRGEEGSVGFIKGDQVKAESYPVSRVVDTVGAGDAFAAGFLSVYIDSGTALNPGIPREQLLAALERANILGALATQYKGDWEGIPTLQEVNQLINGKQVITR